MDRVRGGWLVEALCAVVIGGCEGSVVALSSTEGPSHPAQKLRSEQGTGARVAHFGQRNASRTIDLEWRVHEAGVLSRRVIGVGPLHARDARRASTVDLLYIEGGLGRRSGKP